MTKEKRLEMIKLMVESLELPKFETIKGGDWCGEPCEYERNVSGVTQGEFERNCVQIRKELTRLYIGDK